jgi:tRNA modification GTPase|tara:strand:+ start:160 stop:1524 length:1365 start_codon:yes stop_codon:yes gene_type:complete
MITSDTIVAAATPHGYGGISVVRMSGSESKNIIRSVSIRPKNKKAFFKHKTVSLVRLIDETNSPFEEGLVTFFRNPHSYTGEDVIEISCHGSPSIVNKLISACCDRGARVAEPGEFTKRAFLNGKIDLIQAESVAALIQSKTSECASLNFKMLNGDLSFLMENIKKLLIGLLSKIEFELDVSEESLQPELFDISLETLASCNVSIKKALSNYNSFRMLNEGACVVICGEPNVGKSTLLNCLSGSSRAITSPYAGTTRDTVESTISIGGVPVTLIDTAGLRSSDNKIEKEGVLRAEEKISNSDCIVFLTSTNGSIKSPWFEFTGAPVIHVINKSDLCTKQELSSLKKQNPKAVVVSAKTSYGTEMLLKTIKDRVGISPSLGSSVPIITNRQNTILKKILNLVKNASSLLSGSDTVPYELVSFELRDALGQLDCILGKTVTDDILDSVFSDFCVGK